ncbi:hypothetical protein EMIT07CA2_550072 [Brevibacillus sp. IT-7CA2]|uniref:hypothetical protein n=1 Tax=Brevibacillus sp. IT-7CA2 TaxID=3026436 RepID=UPI0039DFF2A2
MQKKVLLLESIKELNLDQRNALLGYIFSKYMDDEEFQKFVLDGINLLKGVTFDEDGLPIPDKINLQ